MRLLLLPFPHYVRTRQIPQHERLADRQGDPLGKFQRRTILARFEARDRRLFRLKKTGELTLGYLALVPEIDESRDQIETGLEGLVSGTVFRILHIPFVILAERMVFFSVDDNHRASITDRLYFTQELSVFPTGIFHVVMADCACFLYEAMKYPDRTRPESIYEAYVRLIDDSQLKKASSKRTRMRHAEAIRILT